MGKSYGTTPGRASLSVLLLLIGGTLSSNVMASERVILGSTEPTYSGLGFMTLDPFYGSVSLCSGVSWVDSRMAEQHHIGTSASNFYVAVGMGLFDLVTASFTAGAFFPKDHAVFEEDVWYLLGGPTGEVTTVKSDLQAASYSYAAGLRTPSFCIVEGTDDTCLALHGFLNYGKMVLEFSRYISKCRDCRSESFGRGSGTFFEPGLSVGFPSRKFKFGMELTTSLKTYAEELALRRELRFSVDMLFL